jgi:hypothetical protein
MTMDAPFVPTPLPEFDQVRTTWTPEDDNNNKKGFFQSISEAAHSYLDSTTASRLGSVNKDHKSNKNAADDAETAERKRQFFMNVKFHGDQQLFENF